MRIEQDRLSKTVHVLRDMGARKIILFGSMVDDPEHARDLDLAVEGISLNRILDADLAVHEAIGMPTDLIAKEENPSFYEIIEDYGRVLYDTTEDSARDRARTAAA